MPHYVDGFLLPVPKDKIGDDLDVQDQVPFPRLIETKPDETVVFAWIVFESREHRDQVNAKVMADPRMASMGEKGEMPFDFKRMGLRRVQDHCRSLTVGGRAVWSNQAESGSAGALMDLESADSQRELRALRATWHSEGMALKIIYCTQKPAPG
jgi:uncharacterized protein YbaA (DUF1428 family)